MTTIVTMRSGRLTLPAEIRRHLGIEADGIFEVEETADDALLLRPATVLRREDAWAYTPEHRSLLKKAHRDSREGRVHRLSEEELAQLGETE